MNVHRNEVTKASPIVVAQHFAVQNFSTPDDLLYADRILALFREQRFSEGKKLCDEFTRPEFVDGLSYYSRKQFTALLTKVPFQGNSQERQHNAEKAFWASEVKCKRVNRRLRHYLNRPNRIRSEDLRVCLSRAKEEIRKVLGNLTEEKLSKLIELSYPGKGVSVGTRNKFRVSLPYKLGDTDLAVTAGALPYARQWVETSLSWWRLHAIVDWESKTYTMPYVTAEGNRIAFVPKDARTLRTIAIEPALNVGLQLGVHKYLADRLSRFGNPIDDQKFNQLLSELGSKTPFGSSLATIDLAQASDSLCTELVRWMLPSAWFGYLDDLRSKKGSLKGNLFTYEKFSSMGNGFTFALETLIFWSLARAVNSITGGVISSVYGDDIIIDDKSALLLTEVLEFVGFAVNREKTFYHGPFRESCGADWHHGCRVTPQYLRTARLRSTDLYNLINRFDPVFSTTGIKSYLRREIEKVEPVLYGLENEDSTSCWFIPFNSAREKRLLVWNPRFQQWTFKAWTFRALPDRVPTLSAYSAALYGAAGSGDMASLRGRGTFRLRTFTPGVTRDLPAWKVG